MDQLDRIFKAIAVERPNDATLIVCLYTGAQLPQASAPMPRDPAPATGKLLEDLDRSLDAALTENQAVHDGAIMVGREAVEHPYRITGWSFRLLPSAGVDVGVVNRGSAFHSCLAMSREPDVDAMYLVSAGRAYRFCNGLMSEL